MLARTNSYRKKHGVAPLVWDANIGAVAQNYASGCPQGHSGNRYGENLACEWQLEEL